MIRQVPVDRIRQLRHAVLRPGQPAGASRYPGDADGLHFAAEGADGSLLGCVSVLPEPAPEETAAWRLRGMATDPAVRGTGYGRALLTAAVDELRRRGVPLVWCTARAGAEGFYLKYGWQPVGPLFDLPPNGPHRRMLLRLS